jgi:hypothetical protein
LRLALLVELERGLFAALRAASCVTRKSKPESDSLDFEQTLNTFASRDVDRYQHIHFSIDRLANMVIHSPIPLLWFDCGVKYDNRST